MALAFDGINDSLSAELTLPLDRCTVSMWFRQITLSDGVLFETYAIPNGWDRSVQVHSDGKVTCRIWSSPGSHLTTSSSAITPGQWTHALYRHGANAGGQRLVLSGVPVVNPIQQSSFFTSQTNVIFAGGHFYNLEETLQGEMPFSGEMAELAIWQVELNDAEEQVLAAGASPLTLTHRLSDLLLYQDLLGPLNGSGVGSPVVATGAPLTTPHTRRLSLRTLAGFPGKFPRSPIPHFVRAGAVWEPTAEHGEVFGAGALLGQTATIQESN